MFSDQPYAYPRGNSAESAQENISSINYVAGSRQTGGPMPDLGAAYFTDVQPTVPTVYAELREIQQPRLGRKYASKDRRPLDPPPVVQLQVFEVFEVVPHPPGTPYLSRKEITSTIDTSNYTCIAHLHSARSPSIVPAHPSSGGYLYHPPAAGQGYGFDVWAGNSGYANAPMTPPRLYQPTPQGNSELTNKLVGGKVATANTIELNGQEIVVFPFPDLSVQLEGEFYLRYDLYDLSAMYPIPGFVGSTSECQATCTGGTCIVYPTKEAPTLPPSTDITKALYDAGVRVTYRKNPRTRRGGKSSSPSDTSSQG
ncbi:velvet factor-domain-containing protein [Schizophyllum commune]